MCFKFAVLYDGSVLRRKNTCYVINKEKYSKEEEETGATVIRVQWGPRKPSAR